MWNMCVLCQKFGSRFNNSNMTEIPLNFQFTTYFSKHNTLLISARSDGPKFAHAKKWGIPVVNVQWLTDVMLGNFSALNQMEHLKFQQFTVPPNFCFDPILVPNLMRRSRRK